MNAISFIETVKRLGVDFFTGVPDSLLKPLCSALAGSIDAARHVTAANEGGAVALAAGHYLGTGHPALVYMQNSGQGNAVNPLLSLADPAVYSIPMILLVGWRGEPGTQDEPQHKKQGQVTEALFSAMDIPCEVLEPDLDRAAEQLERIVHQAREKCQPAALLVRANTFASQTSSVQIGEPQASCGRRELIIERFLTRIPDDAVIVSTTGHISRELYTCRERMNGGHEHDFLTVGSMGHALQIALGIAMAKSEIPVFCLDGDGAALMHMGALAIAGQSSCANLHHLLLNNGAHGSVGGQRTVGFDVDFPAVARACGYVYTDSVRESDALDDAFIRFVASRGPAFLECRTGVKHREDLERPVTSPTQNREALMRFLGASQ